MPFNAMKVGELAKRTGLSVRTLHHYDEIGLLTPSLHSESGHRLYRADDLARLQHILSLRQLGFSLKEIRECLEKPDFSPLEVIRNHTARLQEQIALQRELCDRLERLAIHLESAENVSAEDFLRTIEVMNMIENYYTPEQLEYLKKRREAVGEERMAQAPNDWATLNADIAAAFEQGLDPADARVQDLVRRQQALIAEFTGGDAGINESLKRLWEERGPELAAQHGMNQDPQVTEFFNKALALAQSGNG